MSNESHNEGYMLLFLNNTWHDGLSMEEMQSVASKWMDWFKDLSAKGIATAGQPLAPTGKVISGKGGRNVSDGPYAEAKEAIGGYFLLKVETIEEAVAIGKQCPGLAYGSIVEVRPVMEQCPLSKTAASAEALASA
jgi:hypothetical protein